MAAVNGATHGASAGSAGDIAIYQPTQFDYDVSIGERGVVITETNKRAIHDEAGIDQTVTNLMKAISKIEDEGRWKTLDYAYIRELKRLITACAPSLSDIAKQNGIIANTVRKVFMHPEAWEKKKALREQLEQRVREDAQGEQVNNQLNGIYAILQNIPVADIAQAILFDQRIKPAEGDRDIYTRAIAKLLALRSSIVRDIGKGGALKNIFPHYFGLFLKEIEDARERILISNPMERKRVFLADVGGMKPALLQIGRFLESKKIDTDLELFLEEHNELIAVILHEQDALVEQIFQQCTLQNLMGPNLIAALRASGHTIQKICLKDKTLSLADITCFLRICPNLIELRLQRCDVGDDALREIVQLYKLKILDLRGNPRITDQGVRTLSALRDQLTSLNLNAIVETFRGPSYPLRIQDSTREITNNALVLLSQFSQLQECAISLYKEVDIDTNRGTILERGQGPYSTISYYLYIFLQSRLPPIFFRNAEEYFITAVLHAFRYDMSRLDPLTKQFITDNGAKVKELDLSEAFYRRDEIDILSPLVEAFPNVEKLRLSGISAKYTEQVRGIWQFRHLRDLSISYSAVTDDDLSGIRDSQLVSLTLSEMSRLEGKVFAFLPSTLQTLNCSRLQPLKDTYIKNLGRQELSNLTGISFSYTNLIGSEFQHLPPSLRLLNLIGCEKLPDEAIGNLAHLPQLHTLLLDGAWKITGSHFNRLPSSLLKLDCGGCPITDESVAKFAHLHKLIELALCPRAMTGSTFHTLPLSLQLLKYTIYRRQDITKEGLASLARLKSLTRLHIRPQIMAPLEKSLLDQLDQLQKELQNCKI